MKKILLISVVVVFIAAFLVFGISSQRNIQYDPKNVETWFDNNNVIFLTDAEQVRKGMPYGRVIKLIGKANRQVGSGFTMIQYNCDNGQKMTIWLDYAEDRRDPWIVEAIKIE